MEYNFGEKVEKLLTESGKTKKSLYDFLKMTANGFDGMIKNNSLSAVRLAQIADYFGKPVSYFYINDVGDSNKTDNPEGFGDQVVRKMADDIGELRHFFEEEIRTKNRQLESKDVQIVGLQRMLESVLGKSRGVANRPTSNEETTFDDNVLEYLNGGLDLSRPSALSQKTFLPGYEAGTTPLAHVANTVTIK